MDHRGMATNGGGGAGVDAAGGVAPFVAKTYRMVDDPATDGVIAWGRDNNSFVVADPFVFSQTHLLSQIVRRSSGGSNSKRSKDDVSSGNAVDDEDAVAMEVVRLRREQRAIEEQVAAMWRRVQETERRPKQMLAFLIKVAGDPQVLRRLVSGAGGPGGAGSDATGFATCTETEDAANIKRARLLLDAGGSGGSSGSDGGAVDFGGFYSTGGGEDDGGFCSDYLQPPPYVFPVNSGY